MGCSAPCPLARLPAGCVIGRELQPRDRAKRLEDSLWQAAVKRLSCSSRRLFSPGFPSPYNVGHAQEFPK